MDMMGGMPGMPMSGPTGMPMGMIPGMMPRQPVTRPGESLPQVEQPPMDANALLMALAGRGQQLPNDQDEDDMPMQMLPGQTASAGVPQSMGNPLLSALGQRMGSVA